MKLRFLKVIQCIPDASNSVLDIGCGPGHFCIALAQKEISNIEGIDFSEEMICLAKENANKKIPGNNINFRVVDFLNYHDEQKFDYSVMMGFIEYFENPEKIINKAIQKTNKKLYISFPNNKGILAFQRQVRYKNRCFLKLYSKQELIELLSKLNVSSFEIEPISRDYFVTLTI